MEEKPEREEIKEEGGEGMQSSADDPSLPNPKTRSAKTKVPEVEIHVFRHGKGPIEVFKARLGGWDQNQLEVLDILDRYGFKSIFAFNPSSGRGVPIRFHPRNGRSVLPYSDGSVIFIDGEPKDSLVKPITKILVGVAILGILMAFFLRETPEWLKKSNLGGMFPPWVLACMVIVFIRLRKRTKDILKKYGR